jgi:hypothetical protein
LVKGLEKPDELRVGRRCHPGGVVNLGEMRYQHPRFETQPPAGGLEGIVPGIDWDPI